MLKRIFAFICLPFISVCSYSQDVGYRSFDAGGEYQYTKDGPVFSLQLAFNAEEHHSIVLRGGYMKLSGKTTIAHTGESGSGWGGSVGYRYHFSVIPKRFFIGPRAGLWNMNISWSDSESEGTSKLLMLQPALETGYTLIINDYAYITPFIAAGIQTTLSSKGEKTAYGSGFILMAGISLGWRF